jgi:hypothetical protein
LQGIALQQRISGRQHQAADAETPDGHDAQFDGIVWQPADEVPTRSLR